MILAHLDRIEVLQNNILVVNRPRKVYQALLYHMAGRERKTISSRPYITQAATNLYATPIPIAFRGNKLFLRSTLSPDRGFNVDTLNPVAMQQFGMAS